MELPFGPSRATWPHPSDGERAAGEKGVEFYYADLRKRFSDSRHITKPMGLYRQQYCGCLYSEWERYTQENSKS